jgi:hypothetical protein
MSFPQPFFAGVHIPGTVWMSARIRRMSFMDSSKFRHLTWSNMKLTRRPAIYEWIVRIERRLSHLRSMDLSLERIAGPVLRH